ncbi:MAG: alpha/beta hydrolase [Clostridia bacterium]
MKKIFRTTTFILLVLVMIFLLYVIAGNLYTHLIVLQRVDYMGTPPGEFHEIGDARIHYVKTGQGPTLILVHGFLGSTDNFKKIIGPLSDEYTVYALDLIGFGHSDKNLQLHYSKKASSEIIAGFMEQKGLSSAVLMGHSMGGEVCINLALDHPRLVDRLILLNSAGLSNVPGYSQPEGSFRELGAFFIDNVVFTYPGNFLAGMNVFYDKGSLDRIRRYEFFAVAKQTNAKVLMRLSEDNDSGLRKDEISGIAMPTLIVWGRQDRVIDLEYGMMLSGMITGSELVVIEESGHLPFEEKPVEFVEIILSFLNSER